MLTLPRTSFDLDLDSIDPGLPWLNFKFEKIPAWKRAKELRSANNARERTRIRNLNHAINRLGDICDMYWKSPGPRTKLEILTTTIKLIKRLEEKLQERQINPRESIGINLHQKLSKSR